MQFRRVLPRYEENCGNSALGVRYYCTPRIFDQHASLLFHNNCDGTFTEVGHNTAIGENLTKAHGVVAADLMGPRRYGGAILAQRDVERAAASFSRCHNVRQCGEFKVMGAAIRTKCVSCHMPLQQSNTLKFENASGKLDISVRTHRIAIYQEAAQ